MSGRKPPSPALRTLAANLDLLVGRGKAFASNDELGKLPSHAPLTGKLIQRIRKLEGEPGIDKVARIADVTGIPLPLLLVPNMRADDLYSGFGIRKEISSLIGAILEKENVRPLTTEEIDFLRGALSMVKRAPTIEAQSYKNPVM